MADYGFEHGKWASQRITLAQCYRVHSVVLPDPIARPSEALVAILVLVLSQTGVWGCTLELPLANGTLDGVRDPTRRPAFSGPPWARWTTGERFGEVARTTGQLNRELRLEGGFGQLDVSHVLWKEALGAWATAPTSSVPHVEVFACKAILAALVDKRVGLDQARYSFVR